MFSQPEFQEKGGGLPKLNWSRYITGWVNIIQSLSLEVQAKRTDSGFSKTFRGVFVDYLCNCSPKIKTKIFDFICCKLPELAGCSTTCKCRLTRLLVEKGDND